MLLCIFAFNQWSSVLSSMYEASLRVSVSNSSWIAANFSGFIYHSLDIPKYILPLTAVLLWRQMHLWYLPLQEQEAIAMETVVKVDQQADVSSSLFALHGVYWILFWTMNIYFSRMNICHTLFTINGHCICSQHLEWLLCQKQWWMYLIPERREGIRNLSYARKECNIQRYVMFHHWQREECRWESTYLV